MNVFDLHGHVIKEYRDYFTSFLNISAEDIKQRVDSEVLNAQALWPEALLQLNPSYKRAETVETLVQQGLLHSECNAIFRNERGKSYQLYVHQREALQRAVDKRPYVVTSGTGSGKSLAYFLPIFDTILSENPEAGKVRAIVVYPMNALVNSQEESLKALRSSYVQRTGQEMPVRFASYTGQTTHQQKQEIQRNPPHIILTNYVMLEMILIRPEESDFVDPSRADLRYLVMDELHTYRGRQGADVALLLRRLQERNGGKQILPVGTSATMATAPRQHERQSVVAEFATRFFGVEFAPEDVIEETLDPKFADDSTPTEVELAAAVRGPLPASTWEEFRDNPLSPWIEQRFGLRVDGDGLYRRQHPTTLRKGATELADLTGLSQEVCEERLRQMLLLGSEVPFDGSSVFAFKLHQFISQGDAVYATLEPEAERLLTLEGQVYAPGSRERLLFPLVFCRHCGQEYYGVRYDRENQLILPVSELAFEISEETDPEAIEEGYIFVDPGETWRDEVEDLPEHWMASNTSLKKNYRPHQPKRLYVSADGRVHQEETGLRCWFQPQPFMLCQCCGEAYTRRDTNDFRKLARLSSEGRSTATTLLSLTTVGAMGETELDDSAQKILSFTDNRQDASLQSGHFNDFIQIAQLRSALYSAVSRSRELRFDQIARSVYDELGFQLNEYARGADTEAGIDPNSAQGGNIAETFRDLIEYRLYVDLQRGWRIVQPNLEQCGLLHIEYEGLKRVADDSDHWTGILAPFGEMTEEKRFETLVTILDEMRRQLTIDARTLVDRSRQEQLKNRTQDYLNEQWALDENERLRYASMYILPGGNRAPGDFSLSERSVIGRWLIQLLTPYIGGRLNREGYSELIYALVSLLCHHAILIEQTEGTGSWHRTGIRLRGSAILWQSGNGKPRSSPLRRYRATGEAFQDVEPEANRFFRDFYPRALELLRGMHGGAHTAQVAPALRQQREDLFREGDLKALFCSPTMELGVDIRDLNAVHMRNVPPTPANYAQRSGRAGRAGQPAVIFTYCSAGSGHDQYYFHNRPDMVQGAVAAPTLELGNEDLVRAHLHAAWLAETGLTLSHDGGSILAIIDPQGSGLPLRPEIEAQITLSEAALQECIGACRRIVDACELDPANADWLHSDWIEETVRRSAESFDHSFDRWRDLFHTAMAQLQKAQSLIAMPFLAPNSQTDVNPEELQRDATRQLRLLTLQNVRSEESDFYAYRYLATEGFLPGYNFPALPVRAYVQSRGEGEFISRPRFLALSEFGPDNTIYHEGAKHQSTRVWLSGQDAEQRFRRAKACEACGYVHAGEEVNDEQCRNCGTSLKGDNIEMLINLLEMPTVSTRRRNRITCDEEERQRQGYDISTHYRFATAQNGRLRYRTAATYSTAHEAPDDSLLHFKYGPSASLWRINHRWRRMQTRGYRLNLATGQWLGNNEQTNGSPDAIRNGVRLYVQDTANALLVYIDDERLVQERGGIESLQHALTRGIQATFQVEGSELASERLGSGSTRGILYWEAAEGGLGVLRRLVEEADVVARVARKALEILHFDKDGNDLRPPEDEENGCARACYECLLSYYNQRDHIYLNRHLVRDFLLKLIDSTTRAGTSERSYDDHYDWLRSRTDSRSELERRFIDHLYATKRRLPDETQYRIQDGHTIPDFFYADRFCVYCDGSVHDEPQQAEHDKHIRAELRSRGYHIIVIRYDEDMEATIQKHSYLFGEPQS